MPPASNTTSPAGRVVPDVHALLDVGVEGAGRHPAEVEGAGPEPPDVTHSGQEWPM